MAIITPDAVKNGITDLNRDRIISWGATGISLAGLQPAAKDIIALSPAYMKAGDLYPRFVKLAVRVDGVFPATADLVLFNDATGGSAVLADFVNNTELDEDNLQDGQVAGAGKKIIHRVFREGVRIGIRTTAALAAKIAAAKTADVYLAFEANSNLQATESALAVAA